ncbi:hypothetical protein DM02DRAFT_351405 [Periconia macrospinosa]|uniref:Uncharacterized protein n=1 Tax=Periconia macrospinosa TaxID=97972 RepID=A0A2V1E918_9PLEO|nr:hypothetical protein DM02DRAFT_351405 [Periconia macrospinosa]
MPQFSARLKQNLAFECLDTDADDLIEPPTKDLYDVDVRTAKRRRIEKIAALCLQGQRPVIITAGLRGPFDKSWRNPWIRKHREEALYPGPSGVLSQIPSPETARGLNHPDLCQEHISKPDDHGQDIPVTYDVSENNPFWLSRTDTQEKNFESPGNGNCEHSPSRSRSGIQPIESDGRIQIGPPKCAIGPTRPSPGPNAFISSASASMALSSPIKHTTTARCETLPTNASTPKDVADQENPVIVPNTTEKLQYGQGEKDPTSDMQLSMESTPIVPATHAKKAISLPPTFTPINNPTRRKISPDTTMSKTVHVDETSPTAKKSHRRGTDIALPAIVGTGSPSAPPRRLSRDDLRQSAERCSQPQPKRKRNASNTPSHELIASPALGSATGFRYKRAGDSRAKTSGGQDLRAGKKSTSPPAIARREPSPPVEVGSGPGSDHDVSTGTSDGEQQSPKTNEHSMFSTQAAMMLAHLEFQESQGTLRASLPSPIETPPKTHEVSVTCTPFSTFNAELDRQHPPVQAVQDVLISTQDLLAAASPFAFSTAKKKKAKPISSSLKFSVFPSRDEGARTSAASVSRSPTPSNRVPLQEKRARVVFGNNESEKSCQESKQSTKVQLKLPQLDLGKSLGDFGLSNGDVDLADGYLGNYEVP